MGRRASFAAAATLCLSSAYGAADRGLHSFDERAVQHVNIPAIVAAGLTAFIERPIPFDNETTVQGEEMDVTRTPMICSLALMM
jgi:hypothetical protein